MPNAVSCRSHALPEAGQNGGQLLKDVSAAGAPPLRTVLGVLGLADGEGHVAVLDHVLDLLPHCTTSQSVLFLIQSPGKERGATARRGKPTRQDKKHKPVHDQHGPKDGHVKDLEPAADKRDGDGAGGGVPELELRQAADEGAKLFVLLGRERADRPVLHVVVERIVGRVELGLQEGQEQVEQVDAEGIGDCVETEMSVMDRGVLRAVSGVD